MGFFIIVLKAILELLDLGRGLHSLNILKSCSENS